MLAVVAIVTIAFVARWRFLHSSPYPFGIDGFYYAIQLRSLLAGEPLYYPASPMVFWLMMPGAWALGPIAGAKLGASLGTALAAAPIYAIVRRATADRAAGIAAAAVVATAAGSFHLATEFVKQGVGLTLALTFVATLAGALDTPPGRSRGIRFALAAVLFGGTLLAHLSSVGIAVAFVVPPLCVRATQGGSARRLRAGALMLTALVAVVVLVVLFVPAARHGMGLAQLFGPASTDFIGEYAFHHEVALGALAAMALGATVMFHRIRGTQATETGAPSAESRALLVGPAVLAVMLAIPWLSVRDQEGLIFRLRLMAFVPLAICAPSAVALLFSATPRSRRQLLLIAASVGLLVLVPLRYVAAVSRPIVSLMPGAAAIAEYTPPDAIIIVRDRQLAFTTKWAANREARTRPPSADDVRPLFWLASPGVLTPSVLRELPAFEQQLPAHLPRPVRLMPEKPDWMILFAEPTWRALIQASSPVPLKADP